MKVLGIDDNSEAFSLLITGVIGLLLFLFTYALNKKVMGTKVQSDVSVMQHALREDEIKSFLFSRPQNMSILNGKPLFNGISKETAKDLSKLN